MARMTGSKVNPLLTLASTDKKRLDHHPDIWRSGKVVAKLSPVEWLAHLESERELTGELKTTKIREKDLRLLKIFWKMAKQRGLLRALFASSLNESQIAKEMTAKGFPMSKERVRQIKNAWELKRDTRKTKNRNILQRERQTVEANLDLSFARLARRLGVNRDTLRRWMSEMGIKKPRASPVSNSEYREREEFLDSAGITHLETRPLYSSLADLKSRALEYFVDHDFIVPDESFLKQNVKTSHIQHLEALKIDWRNEKLSRLIFNSSEYVDTQLAILNSVGADSELHYLMLKRLSGQVEKYSKKNYSNLRTAVMKRDVGSLLQYSGKLCGSIVKNRFWTGTTYFDIAKEAAMTVLRHCAFPERNPATFLALMSAGIRVALITEAVRLAVEKSLDRY